MRSSRRSGPSKPSAATEEVEEQAPAVSSQEVSSSSDAQPKEETKNGDVADGDKAKNATEEKEKEEKPDSKEGTEEAADKPKAAKPVKKKIPSWATLSKSQQGQVAKSSSQQANVNSKQVIVEAVEATRDKRGVASVVAIRKHVASRCPHWPKVTFKTALNRALTANLIIQVKGNSVLSGSFKLDPKAKKNLNPPPKKAPKNAKTGAKKAKKSSGPLQPLDNLLPNIFTWIVEPKEASYGLIKKYIKQHYENLEVEGKGFRKAMEKAEERGQLERITGKGGSGTFQLVDGAKKAGTLFEDAIEDAIIAMNEPKDASIIAMRNYLSEYHAEYNTDNRPKTLKNALDRCEAKGWIKRVTGKGFSGTFRLAFPYHPSPRDLWGEWYEENKSEPRPPAKRPKVVEEDDSDDDSEDDDSEEDDSSIDEEHFVARKAPKARRPPPKRRGATAPKKGTKSSTSKARKGRSRR